MHGIHIQTITHTHTHNRHLIIITIDDCISIKTQSFQFYFVENYKTCPVVSILTEHLIFMKLLDN